MLSLSVSKPDFLPAIKALQIATEEKIALVAEQVKIETLAYLVSITEERRPPARPGEPERFAHPGNWADDIGTLALGYGGSVERIPGGVRLRFVNSVYYASFLEDMAGFFVLKGVTDPGGPVFEVLTSVIRELAPEWTVRGA